jgi:hypothetical protein
LRQLVKRIVVGRPASPRVLAELRSAPPELLFELERAFAQDLCLELDYVDRFGKRTKRLIEPHGLLVEALRLVDGAIKRRASSTRWRIARAATF